MRAGEEGGGQVTRDTEIPVLGWDNLTLLYPTSHLPPPPAPSLCPMLSVFNQYPNITGDCPWRGGWSRLLQQYDGSQLFV